MIGASVDHLVGIGLALVGAISVAGHHLLIRIGTDEGRANDAVFVVMLMNVVLLIPAVAVLYYPDYQLTMLSGLSFAAAGLFGTMLGRAFLYTSIDRIGASRTSPVVASQALVATVLGVLVLGESFTLVHGVGVLLIVAGVAAISWETTRENPEELPLREIVVGLALPIGAAVAYGIEPIFANIGFGQGTPATVGLGLKTIAATLGFTLYLAWRDALPQLGNLSSTNIRWYVAAGLANTFFLLAYYLALSLAPVSVVVPIIIVYPVFVVGLSAIFMPQRLEHVTWRLATMAVVVVSGVLVVTLF